MSGTSRKVLWNINIYCTHMANLWNIYGIPIAHVVCLRKSYLAYVWHVPVIYVASLCGTCVACLLYIYCVCWHMEEHSFGISILHLWYVCGLSMVYLCNIYKIVYLWHVYSVCLWYIYGYFLKFSKAQENSKNMLKTSKKHRKTRALTTSHSLFSRYHHRLPRSRGDHPTFQLLM